MNWQNIIEEFSPYLSYIEGPQNILVDNLYRLHCMPMLSQIVDKELMDPAIVSDDRDNVEAFLIDSSYFWMFDQDIIAILEC